MKTIVGKLLLILTLNCEQSTRIVSESLDRQMTPSERWAVRAHYLCCHSCRRFGRQVRFLREALRKRESQLAVYLDQVAVDGLSPEARDRIRQAMTKAGE